jgi:hypothetical protein
LSKISVGNAAETNRYAGEIMIKCHNKISLIIIFIIISNIKSQIISFTPDVDTLYTAGGCTPTQIITTYIRNIDNLDTIKIYPDWNTHFWSKYNYDYNYIYFLINDSLNRYHAELWMEPFQEDFNLPVIIPFDSVIYFDSRNYHFKLKLFDNNNIIDSLSQFCIARIGIGIKDDRNKLIINNYSLSNYPNPFNQTTIIKYYISCNSKVQIQIYDINGRLIDSLINSLISPGYYTYKWQADNLTSGQYFIILKYDNNCIVNKCVLLK